jgi:hypothetical protein
MLPEHVDLSASGAHEGLDGAQRPARRLVAPHVPHASRTVLGLVMPVIEDLHAGEHSDDGVNGSAILGGQRGLGADRLGSQSQEHRPGLALGDEPILEAAVSVPAAVVRPCHQGAQARIPSNVERLDLLEIEVPDQAAGDVLLEIIRDRHGPGVDVVAHQQGSAPVRRVTPRVQHVVRKRARGPEPSEH